MLEKLIVLYKVISFTIMNIFMGVIYTILPIYPAWCYKHALKARGIVYGYWISTRSNRFFTILSSNSCSVNLWVKKKIGNNDVIEIKVHDRNDYEHYYYLKDYNQMFVREDFILIKIYQWVRYIIWYYGVWIWLDDDNNINGLDLRLFKTSSKLYDKLTNDTAVYITTGAKVYTTVFDLPYVDDPRVLSLDKIMYSVYNQEINNYIRDKAIYKTYKSVMIGGIGFKINPLYFRSSINLFGYDVLKNKDGI